MNKVSSIHLEFTQEKRQDRCYTVTVQTYKNRRIRVNEEMLNYFHIELHLTVFKASHQFPKSMVN